MRSGMPESRSMDIIAGVAAPQPQLCPPSHRVARFFFTGVILAMVFLIAALSIYTFLIQ